MGNYAVPIFLHQASSLVSRETEAAFNSYLKMAKNFWERQTAKIVKPEFKDAVGQ